MKAVEAPELEGPERPNQPHAAKETGAGGSKDIGGPNVQPTPMSSRSVMRLQAGAGNAAVSRLVAQRAAVANGNSGGGGGNGAHHAQRARMAPGATHQARANGAGGGGMGQSGAGGGGSALVALDGGQAGVLIDPTFVQRKSDSFAPPALPTAPNPKSDPKFQQVSKGVKEAQKTTKSHPPAKAEAKKAQDASVPPGNDKEGQAKAAQADKMAGAKKSGFDKAAFIAALTGALAKNKPKNLEQADNFAQSGKADSLKADVVGKVGEGKKTASQDMEAKAKEPPDPSVAKEKPVTPLTEEKETKPQTPDFAKGMPDKAPAEQTNLDGAKNETDSKMKDADVSEADLKKSNEPEMMGAVDAKKKGEEHSEKAPQEMRQAEAATLKSTEAGASEKGKADINAMVAKKGAAKSAVAGKKGDTKSKDEAKRAEVTANVNKIFDKTKAETEKILTELDGKVAKEFDIGEAEAKKAFTSSHETAINAYKLKRYGGFGGGLLWLKDKVMDMPSEVNGYYETAKALYVDKMTAVAHRLADIIDGELSRAKARVDQGRDEIKEFVSTLSPDLQKVGAEAAKAVEEKFSSLESDVENKGQSLQDDLASKYTEAMEKVNAEVEKMQAENKGLWDSIKDAVGGAIKTILMLKDLFMGILAKAAKAFKKVIADPLTFIGNFMKAVMAGFTNFATNILDHLKKGLKSWLFGKLAEGGIDVPETFDLKGIIKLVLQILGLTWANIRPRIVKVIGEKAMGVLETTAEVFVILVKEGPGGLIKWMMEKLSDLKDMVMGQIRNYVIEKIVKAGITWVLGMLNPAGALIKIIQALIAVVQWIMEKGEALAALINTVLDAVIDIADGGGGGVPAKIEQALSDAIPLVLSFLAGLLGLGGISEKIKSILEAVQKPVMKAVDFVIMGAIKLAGPIIRAAKGLGNKAKKKYEEGKAKAKAMAAGKKGDAPKSKPTGEDSRDGEVVSVSFTMHGAQHELSGNLGPGFVPQMASANKQAIMEKVRTLLLLPAMWERSRKTLAKLRAQRNPTRAVTRAIVKMDKYLSGKKAQLGDINAIKAASEGLEKAGRSRGQKKATEVRAAMKKLGALVAAYGEKYKTEDLRPKPARPERVELGDTPSYLESVNRTRDDKFDTLEAEHITPGSILEMLVKGPASSGKVLYYKKKRDPATGKMVVDRASPYFLEATIMVTKLIADIKTDLGPSVGMKRDNKLINELKKIATSDKKVPPSKVSLTNIVGSRVEILKRARNKAAAMARSGDYSVGGLTGDALAKEIETRLSDDLIHQTAMAQLNHAWDLARAEQDRSSKSVAERLEQQGEAGGDNEYQEGDEIEFDVTPGTKLPKH